MNRAVALQQTPTGRWDRRQISTPGLFRDFQKERTNEPQVKWLPIARSGLFERGIDSNGWFGCHQLTRRGLIVLSIDLEGGDRNPEQNRA